MLLIILGLILFILLVVFHEWGHFISARKSGVEVEEFGIGFPPKAKTITKKNGTEYTLNWLPLGGFVKLKGEYTAAKGRGTFGSASFGRKTLIIFAGVLMNWLAAAVIFTIVALVGMPQLVENQFQVKSDAVINKQAVIVGQVEPGSPAEKAGLQKLDVISSVGDTDVATSEELRDATNKYSGDGVSITYIRDGKENSTQAALREKTDEGPLGVAPADNTTVRSTWSAPIVGVGTTVQFTALTYSGLYNAVSNLVQGNTQTASESVSGPVGIFVLLKTLAAQGFVYVLFLIAIISLSLAVFNSLPIPALDGGRWFVMTLFMLLKKPLSKDLEERIHGTGMAALMIMVVILTIVDIKRL